MSAATSPGTGLAYGLRRVCGAWGMARSSFYAMTSGQHAEQPPAKRRGPKPAISDQALLVAIEADLEASPWEGEGYRKVWARLRVCRDIRVARKRVLRLMRENNLLSPHRCRRRGGNQIKFWGIQPSYAFVAEPQTNGVAERFNRTLKEQIIHGRIYRNIAELRDAVRDFVELYNAQWIVEKNGYLSPAQARQAWHAAISIRRPPRETNLCPRNRVRYRRHCSSRSIN